MSKNLILTIVAHQGYIRHEDEKSYALQNDLLFSAITQTYIPLLNLFHKLSDEGINFKLALVLSPVLTSLLDDELIKSQYLHWLEKRISLGQSEVERFKNDEALLKNAGVCLAKIKQAYSDFTDRYGQNLLKEFKYFAEKGCLELLATCATYAFLPHYGDLPEVLNAQVEVGLFSHRHYFGSNPDGFYLPYLGYTNGIEKVLRSYGFRYTIVDNRAMLFSDTVPDYGIFAPVRCDLDSKNSLTQSSIAVFAQDCDPQDDLMGENGFSANSIYKNQGKDIAFELSGQDLCKAGFLEDGMARCPSYYRYWNKKDGIYNEDEACAQAKKDAASYVNSKLQKLSQAQDCMEGQNPELLGVVDAKSLGQDWAEGIVWLEEVIRLLSASDTLMASPSDLVGNIFSLQKISLYPSACQGNNCGEDMLDSSNNWMLRYTRKMSDRMIDLSDRYPNETGLKVRLLNLAGRELLLSQSGEWAKMIHDEDFPEYARESFTYSIKSFLTAFDALGSNTVSTEWLTKVEKDHCLFPWLNFRVFSKKK